MGAIARDCKGKFVAARCKEIHFVADPFMAEAYALRDGLSLAQFLGGNKVIIQSDNMQVIETVIMAASLPHLPQLFLMIAEFFLLGIGKFFLSIVIERQIRLLMS
jgi:membrane protein YqaA with SNARE-associated domain